MVMVFSLCACGSGRDTPTNGDIPTSSNTTPITMDQPPTTPETFTQIDKPDINTYQIGDTTSSSNGNFEMTLTQAEFAERINLDKTSNNFCMPMAEDETSDYVLTGQNGNVFIYFTFEYHFTGKQEDKDMFFSYGKPTVIYDGDYFFEEDYFSFTTSDTYPDWNILSTDGSDNLRKSLGLGNMMFTNRDYKPLSDDIYKIRGFIAVPEEVMNNAEASLAIKFSSLGERYTIR